MGVCDLNPIRIAFERDKSKMSPAMVDRISKALDEGSETFERYTQRKFDSCAEVHNGVCSVFTTPDHNQYCLDCECYQGGAA